jgi:polysaccharide pyruvyl transferase WcaK-like protein
VNRLLLSRTQAITIRDETSREYLAQLDIGHNNVFLTGDLAFALDGDWHIRASGGNCPEKPSLVGICPVKSPKHLEPVYYEKLAKLCDYLIRAWGSTIMFIPHCTDSADNDREAICAIRRRMAYPGRSIFLSQRISCLELRELVASCDLFAGFRFHSIIDACCRGVPAVALVTKQDHRITDLLKRLGCKNNIIDVANVPCSKIVEQFEILRSENWKSALPEPEKLEAERVRARLNMQIMACLTGSSHSTQSKRQG